jgi:hypothetical protein
MTFDNREPSGLHPRYSKSWLIAALVGVVIILGLAWTMSGRNHETASTGSTTTGQGIAKTPLTSTSPVATAPPSTTPATPAR